MEPHEYIACEISKAYICLFQVMESGQITQVGTFESLLTGGAAFEQLVNAHRDAVTTSGTSNYHIQEELEKGDMVSPDESFRINLHEDSSEGDISVKCVPGVQLIEEEEKETGDVGWKPFWDYIFVSKGTLLLCLAILAQSCFFGLQAASTYWLALAIQVPKITNGMLIGVYTAVSTFSAVFVHLRSYLAAHVGLKASKAFFSGFTDAIFKAPMLFFDSTPVGRILTRVSILDLQTTYFRLGVLLSVFTNFSASLHVSIFAGFIRFKYFGFRHTFLHFLYCCWWH